LPRISIASNLDGIYDPCPAQERSLPVTRLIFLAAFLLALSACTVVKINPGGTTTIEHEGGADVAKDLATRTCRKGGEQTAEIISTVNKDASQPQGTGKQVTTFRCTSAGQ
jgi:hypothetical protein